MKESELKTWFLLNINNIAIFTEMIQNAYRYHSMDLNKAKEMYLYILVNLNLDNIKYYDLNQHPFNSESIEVKWQYFLYRLEQILRNYINRIDAYENLEMYIEVPSKELNKIKIENLIV